MTECAWGGFFARRLMHACGMPARDSLFFPPAWLLALTKMLFPAPSCTRVCAAHLPHGTFVTLASGLPDGGRHSSNWYDIIEFGHGDAYVGSYSIWAWKSAVDMKRFLGDHAAADAYNAVCQNAVRAFNAAFWSDATGHYSDWVDVIGARRDYFFTDHNFLAVYLGIANQTQGAG